MTEAVVSNGTSTGSRSLKQQLSVLFFPFVIVVGSYFSYQEHKKQIAENISTLFWNEGIKKVRAAEVGGVPLLNSMPLLNVFGPDQYTGYFNIKPRTAQTDKKLSERCEVQTFDYSIRRLGSSASIEIAVEAMAKLIACNDSL